MIRSMTGFGTADGVVGDTRVTVEIRTVNHRFFNPSFKVPATFQRWEADMRDLLRRHIARGHATLSIKAEREASGVELQLDETRLAAYVTQLRELSTRLRLDSSLDLGMLLRLPDVLGTSVQESSPEAGPAEAAALLEVVGAAAEALNGMREAEGERMADFLEERLQIASQALDRIAERAPERMAEQLTRLRTNVATLTTGVAVDEQRIAQEIAILADRMDIQEEISRFRAHIAAFRDSLSDTGGEQAGKRLGFLLQEMLREANTIGSKANDMAIVADVVILKEELERLREQVENVE